MEQLRDSYASDSLVILAKSLGFNGEPAHIDLASNREQYTPAIIQKWLRNVHNVIVYAEHSSGSWSAVIEHSQGYSESSTKDDYDEILEDGLREACMFLKMRQNAYKVLE